MRRHGLILFGACAFAASSPAFANDQGGQIDYETARDERRLIIVRAAGTVALDGVARRSRHGRRPRSPGTSSRTIRTKGRPATYDTEVRVVYDDEALYFGVFAKDDEPSRHHRQRPQEGLQHRHQRRLPRHPRHASRTAQRLPVRDQSGRREVGRADGQRGAREQRQLGRHLGRAHAHHRDRLERRDPDSVPDAEVRPTPIRRPGA